MKSTLLLGLLLLNALSANAQFYSLRTNLVGDATLNLNAELGMTVNRRWSLHFPVQVNPFVYDKGTYENRKFRNLTFEPGVRYWFAESYNRGFVGLMGLASRYDISHIWDKHRYDGHAFGLGATLGYALPIGKRWNLEFEGGPGLVYARYDKYVCKHCGRRLGRREGVYLVPARINLGIVYLF